MEVPTLKEVVDKMEWSPHEIDNAGSDYYLNGKYEWKGKMWEPVIRVIGDGQAFEWESKLRTGRKQCRSIGEAVRLCAIALLSQVEEHARKLQKEEEEKRKLDEYRRKAQGWAGQANSVIIED